jgi:hypothetical protein
VLSFRQIFFEMGCSLEVPLFDRVAFFVVVRFIAKLSSRGHFGKLKNSDSLYFL